MYDELVKRLMYCRNNAAIITDEELVEIAEEAADAIEELSRAQERWITQERNVLLKSNKAITAERDAAMKRLCEWCGVGCSMENRRAELCEIAAVGLEFLKDDCTSTDCDWELAEEGE